MSEPSRPSTSFWDWSNEAYKRPGVEPLLLALQDRHLLNVNMVLWCVFVGAFIGAPGDLVVRRAADLATHWTSAVTERLRAVRRTLKSPPMQVDGAAATALRAEVARTELAAEKIEQDMLETLAVENVAVETVADGTDRARRALAVYVRQTGAARTEGFSVSLLEELIALTLAPYESRLESAG